ncbi:HAMP domain-containing protein [Alkalibacter rhizosphaerae]|uniref:histidine kinase n=1 Tax=Alkalibacter rhizosphaerae TaxID=2815577 RepID=A0A974XFS1_9FIRM|nr:ATP-binding protein [Alkalibacter rhizosphaerae]QSX07820.1 HAMP domain-containing protein [Alkalibacter rhizosphaerae]
MKLTFRTKFILANMVVVLLTMMFLAIFVIQGLMYYNFDNTQEQLIAKGRETQFYVNQEIRALDSAGGNVSAYLGNALALSEDLSRINNTRVLLYDLEGFLIADSANLEAPEDLQQLEEVQIALELDTGKSVSVYKRADRRSSIYYAMPLFVGAEKLGAALLIQPMDYLDDLITQIVLLFSIASIVGFIIVFLVSHLLSVSIFKPIRKLVETTKELAAGDFDQQLVYDADDEIGNLTKNFNTMSQQIKDKLSQIENEKQKMTSIISSIGDGVIALDLDNKAFIINDSAREILSLYDDSKGLSSLFDKEDLADVIDQVVREQKDLSREIEYNNKHLHVYCNLIQSEKKTIGILLVVRDITKIVELENQQRLFISSVSHELRTPLTTIIGYSDLLQRRGVDNPDLLMKSLQTIHAEGQRLLRLVSDLLDLANYENTQFQMIFSALDLNALLEDVIGQMQIKSGRYNIDIVYNSTELPIIKGDRDRLKQVMINILDNAIKYSQTGDIIRVLATKEKDSILVSVRDFGPGIPGEQVQHIFDAFYRVDEDRSREYGGSGLGLAIVKDIVERHGGDVQVESKMGEGTMILFRLPA